MRSGSIVCTALLMLSGGCRFREIPRPEPNWMPLGGTHGTVTLLDTTRIGVEGDARLVWLRLDSLRAGPGGKPTLVPGARRESLHRVRCGALTVDDLQLTPQGSRLVPAPTDLIVTRGGQRFDQHPYGPQIFPTVCAALSRVGHLTSGTQP
jgi:hypothetical protein